MVCIANILEGACRKHRVIRWGGEEFLIILLSVTEEEAFAISEQIRKEVEQFRFFHENGEFSCTVTLGLHAYNENEGIENSINFADKASTKENAGEKTAASGMKRFSKWRNK